ncbi:MAG TPA: hypothetical protein VGR13_00395, partial [Actinomycetota bacterium]|nr:hypothetical protein [Actinomycetota bacterium]
MAEGTSMARGRARRWLAGHLGALLATLPGKLFGLAFGVAVLSLAAGALFHLGIDRSRPYSEAVWWAFSHMVDPSSLREDEGVGPRLLGVVLVGAGVVLVVGLLFTVLTDLLNKLIEQLAEVQVPVKARDHLVVIGWNDDVPALVSFFATSYRQLAPAGARPLRRIVVLAPRERISERQRMRAALQARCPSPPPALVFGDLAGAEGFALAAVGDAQAVLVTLTPNRE